MGFDRVQVGPLVAEKQVLWQILSHNIKVFDTSGFAAIVGIGPGKGRDRLSPLLTSYHVDQFAICLQRKAFAKGWLTWGTDVGRSHESLRHFASARVVKVPGDEDHWRTLLGNVSFVSAKGGSAKASSKSGFAMTEINAATAMETAHEKLSPPPLRETIAEALTYAKRDAQSGLCHGVHCHVIIDSGTSLIAAPTAALMEFARYLTAFDTIDCRRIDELPVLEFELDGTLFKLPPEAYVLHVEGDTMAMSSIWDKLFFKPKAKHSSMCSLAFMNIDLGTDRPTWILGMPFFRYYYTVFDRADRKMYFALAGPMCKPMSFFELERHQKLHFLERDEEETAEARRTRHLPLTVTGFKSVRLWTGGVLGVQSQPLNA